MTPQQKAQKDDLHVALPSDKEILITRSFDAPRALVWEALTQPEHVRQWLGLANQVCEMDHRVGGKWRFVHRAPDGTLHTFSGAYREVRAPEREVRTEKYENLPGAAYLVTSTLEERGGRTYLSTRILHKSKQNRDGHVQSGMEPGYRQTYAILDAHLATLHHQDVNRMTSKAQTQSKTDDLHITLPSDKELRYTRTFEAAPRLVFAAMTKPEHIKAWYGPHGTSLAVCEMDARPGGKWRYAYPPDEKGVVHAFHGEVREVVPGKRIVFTEIYDPVPGSDHVVTATFEDLGGGRTRLTTHILYLTKEARDGHVQSGMEWGMRQTFERLDGVLARLA